MSKKFVKKIVSSGMCFALVLVLIAGMIPSAKVNAASFSDINDSTMFFKQNTSYTCTLSSAAMLVRRAALLNGNASWTTVTEGNLKSTAWKEGAGLRESFSYAGINVSRATISSNRTQTMINLLSQHPEGIVIYNSKKPHAILLTDYTDGTFYCADPSNYRPSGRIPISQASITVESIDYYWYVSSPSLSLTSPESDNPKGYLDNAEGGKNTVWVRGWAFDPNDVSQSLDIHVYIGGPAGVGEGHGWIIANTYRDDVNNVFGGVGIYHGFDATIQTSLVGMQTVYVYAINIGTGTDNTLIGTATVNITKDTTPPTISDVRVTDMNAEGYTVTCRVEDADGVAKVQFPTWTLANDQDDLAQNWQNNPSCSGTQDGTMWSFRVNDKEHNFERGTYRTHIYAYDNNGNISCHELNFIEFQNTYSQVNTASYNGNTYGLYNDCLTWNEAKTKCEELGGHLVTITSAEEQKTVEGLIQGQARIGYWIGSNRAAGNTWVNGEAFSFSNWRPGEPNNGNGVEDCYGIYTDTGEWNDWQGSNRSLGIGFICEWDAKKVEKPDNPNDMDNSNGSEPEKPENTKNPVTITVPTGEPKETEKPVAAQTPMPIPVPTATAEVGQKPAATTVPTGKPEETETPVTVGQTPMYTPDSTEISGVEQTPTVTTTPTEEPEIPAVEQTPIFPSVSTENPTVTQNPTDTPDVMETPTITSPAVAKKLKISSVKCKRNTKKITGKVSVSEAAVKIKVGGKAYKKATVKGKRFVIKMKNGLKKRTEIIIKVTKKDYKSLIQGYVVK